MPKFSAANAHKEQSAGEFIAKTAAEIQDWLHSNTLNGKHTGKRWILYATLANGVRVVVHQLSPHGHSVVKLNGELEDGSSALFIAHLHSVQLLATYITPSKPIKKAERREIGFHTGIGSKINIKQ